MTLTATLCRITRSVPVTSIKVGERHRKDLGDVRALADSIAAVGLLQPLVVTPCLTLVAGARRLEAVRMLGREEVPVYVVDGLDDARLALRAERDENTCRKDLTLSEAVALGKALEELEKPKAKARQATSTGGADPKLRPACGKFPQADNGKTRDKVGETVGMSGKTYEKAKVVVEAAEEDPDTFGPVQEEMDRTGKVDAAYKKVKGRAAPGPTPDVVVNGLATAPSRPQGKSRRERQLDRKEGQDIFFRVERLIKQVRKERLDTTEAKRDDLIRLHTWKWKADRKKNLAGEYRVLATLFVSWAEYLEQDQG
jgi:ParB family chromosome partitioning protein